MLGAGLLRIFMGLDSKLGHSGAEGAWVKSEGLGGAFDALDSPLCSLESLKDDFSF